VRPATADELVEERLLGRRFRGRRD
jgi:hypothetical protein